MLVKSMYIILIVETQVSLGITKLRIFNLFDVLCTTVTTSTQPSIQM